MIKYVYILFVVLFACTGNPNDALSKNKEALRKLDAILRNMSHNISDTTSIPLETTLQPLPVFNTSSSPTINTDIIMSENLLSQDIEIELFLSNSITQILDALKEPDKARFWPNADSLEKDIQTALNIRYVAVVKLISTIPISLSQDKIFNGGESHFNVFFIDVKKGKLLFTFDFHSKPSGNVNFKYTDSNDYEERGLAFVRSSIWENSRKTLLKELATITNGKFTIN